MKFIVAVLLLTAFAAPSMAQTTSQTVQPPETVDRDATPDCDKVKQQIEENCSKSPSANCDKDKTDKFYQSCITYKKAMASCQAQVAPYEKQCKDDTAGVIPECTTAKNDYMKCIKAAVPQ